MMEESFESKYKNRLYSLVENKRITIEQQDHFLKRGIHVISPSRDFGLKSLGKMLPEIVIGASSRYINKMKFHIRQAILQQIQGVMAKDPISIRYLENPLEEFHF